MGAGVALTLPTQFFNDQTKSMTEPRRDIGAVAPVAVTGLFVTAQHCDVALRKSVDFLHDRESVEIGQDLRVRYRLNETNCRALTQRHMGHFAFLLAFPGSRRS